MSNFSAFQHSNLSKALNGIGARSSSELFDELEALYSEKSRFYHDQSHVAECLLQFQKYRHLAINPDEIAIAIWFHDAVYDTRKNNNEELSARLAEKKLSQLGARSPSISAIVAMILATKSHKARTDDSKLMIDIDLGILGVTPNQFDRYDQQIRREFSWVPEKTYLAERKRVLATFLDRDIIYQTQEIREALESQARENLSRKIAQLSAELVSL